MIGCGGLLQQLAARGAAVAVVYVTDGSASHVKSQRFPPAVLRDLREAEARAALRTLGIRASTRFLRAPDGQLTELAPAARAALVTALAACIQRRRADLILAPLARDPHPDHIATATLVAAAIGASRRRPTVYAYGVWQPVRGQLADLPAPAHATLCEIRLGPAQLERKRAAILAHRSQTGAVIDDDPEGFVIDEALLATWLTPVERFFRIAASESHAAGTSGE